MLRAILALFGMKKMTVASAVAGIHKAINDLDAVTRHHDTQQDTQALVIAQATKKLELSQTEAKTANAVASKLRDLVSV
jgi:hypothetical protein